MSLTCTTVVRERSSIPDYHSFLKGLFHYETLAKDNGGCLLFIVRLFCVIVVSSYRPLSSFSFFLCSITRKNLN